jgi:serine/threonine protein kinase
MGEVYRAYDTKLNRDVALKVLPSEFANDPERMGRFKREAQLLASLSHTSIAAVAVPGFKLINVAVEERYCWRMDREQIVIRKASERRNDGFVPGSPAERIALVWPLTREVVSLNKRQDAERRLQRHVAILG